MRKDYWTGVNHTGLQGSNPLYPKLLPLYRLISDRYRQDHPYEEAQVGNFSAPVPSFYIQDHLGNTRVTYEMDCGPQGARRNLEYVGDYLPYGGILREHIVDRRERFLTTEHERDDQTQLDYRGARYSDSRWGVFMSVDPLAHLRTWVSPYNFVQSNPINRVDPTGALDNPIYGEDGDFLGTDDKGLQGEAIVMNKDDFKQGMSHEDALDKGTLRSNMPLVTSPKIFDKIDNHFAGLPSRPDYDGFVTIGEGIQWAKDHPNTLSNNITPDNSLYLDASKLNFGDLSVDNIGLKQGQKGNVNLFDYVH